MNNRYYILVLLCGLFMASGCNKYLDVQPEASYTEVQVYNNESAVQQALNGVYLSMAKRTLYGAYMTTTIVEMLAQRYKPVYDLNGTRYLGDLVDYQFATPASQQILDTIWRSAYNTILETNVFLSKIDKSIQGKVLPEAHGNQLKGEAIAIRAMIHFDLLRMFGPVYSAASGSQAIPYYTEADGKLQPILAASAVMDKIMADLNQAATLLAQDPVINKGISNSVDFYEGARNQRLNYYAVKALMARAYLWAGKTQEAHAAALEVLNQGEKWFPWTDYQVANDSENPDRIFSSEVLFGVYNPEMYTLYNTYFSPSVYDGALMNPDSVRLQRVFESNDNDYRYLTTWVRNGKPFRTSFKYADIPQRSKPWRFVQPLVRKSELYLLLAETETDPVKALDYLNTERRKRGLVPYEPPVDITSEIRKEFQKEFWAEGQLFFYYKRINATDVPYAPYPYDGYNINPVYNIPLPFSETNTR